MSVQRRCDFTKCVDGKWYMTLGDFEHAYDDFDCTVYGPFESAEAADEYRQRRFSNPGGSCTDASGTEPAPANAVKPDTDEDD
jgi:hypothetical protein